MFPISWFGERCANGPSQNSGKIDFTEARLPSAGKCCLLNYFSCATLLGWGLGGKLLVLWMDEVSACMPPKFPQNRTMLSQRLRKNIALSPSHSLCASASHHI